MQQVEVPIAQPALQTNLEAQLRDHLITPLKPSEVFGVDIFQEALGVARMFLDNQQ